MESEKNDDDHHAFRSRGHDDGHARALVVEFFEPGLQ
jgi:hypothetical protein